MSSDTLELRALRGYALVSVAIGIAVMISGFVRQPRTLTLDELTVKRVKVVDSTGQTRAILAGSFPPRRSAVAGLLFVNSDGMEDGGLTYRGAKRDGQIAAGAILTMDQYGDDQIVALQYNQHGVTRSQGLTLIDRPDSLSAAVGRYYRVLDTMPPSAARDSVLHDMRSRVSPQDLSARRVFVGRDTAKAAVLNLSDRTGAPRLRLTVDSLGDASIAFLDAGGRVVRTISP